MVDMETLLKGVCNKRNLMDIVENFILFDESSGEAKKIIARNHQFLWSEQGYRVSRGSKETQWQTGSVLAHARRWQELLDGDVYQEGPP